MEHKGDDIRALARALGTKSALPPPCRNERAACRLLLRVCFRGRCPRCGGRSTLSEGRTARCTRGHTFSVTSRTELVRTKVPLRHWLAAIWHLHVDRESLSALSFARRYGLRHATAWKLMHKVRGAFMLATPRARGATARYARRNGEPTARHVNAARDEGALTLVDEVALTSPGGPHAPESAAILGRLRAWLTTVYSGVRERYLHLYLAEFASRFGRKVNAS